MTIEELAARSGQTTRNIRAYQSRGLIPAPVSVAGERTAYYGSDHLARLRLIGRLQKRGFSLAGIADLLRAWQAGHSLHKVLGIESAMAEAQSDDSRLIGYAELQTMLGRAPDPVALIHRLRALGLVTPDGDALRLHHPKALELGIEAAAAGIPLDELLSEFGRIQHDAHRIARRFVQLYDRHVWRPYVEAGMPHDRLDELVARMSRLLRDAAEAIEPLMAGALADEIENLARENLPRPDAPAS